MAKSTPPTRLDPNTNTRREFTEAALSNPEPDNAAADWSEYARNLKELFSKLAYDEAMRPNIDQPYMTPAANKNKVYFMWDFVGRTINDLYQMDPAMQTMDRRQQEAWESVMSRSFMASQLILDTKPGMLNQMTESTYPEQRGRHPNFSNEIVEIARRIAQ